MSQDWKSLVTLLPDEKVIIERKGELYEKGEISEGVLFDQPDGTIILTDRRIIGLTHKTKSKSFWSSKKVFLRYDRVFFEINLEDIDVYKTIKISLGYILALSKKPRLYPNEIFDVGFGQQRMNDKNQLQILNELYRELSLAILKSKEPKTIKQEIVQYNISTKFEFGKGGGLLIECPHCGASSELKSKENPVKCSYCGKEYIVPNKLLQLL